MNFEQRGNIKFCFQLDKSFTETFILMYKVYGDDGLSRTIVYEWYKRFRDRRVDIKDDEHPGAKKYVVTDRNIEVVRDFIRKEPKCYMEIELNISKDSIHRILTQHLGLKKFVPGLYHTSLLIIKNHYEFNIAETYLKRQKKTQISSIPL